VRARATQTLDNWGLPSGDGHGPYEDLDGFLTRPAALAESLLDEGIRAMKIWPFDPYAELTGGTRIDAADLERGLRPLREIRAAVGDEIDVMIEMHGLWRREPAERIVAACDPLRPSWYEDPIASSDVDGLAALAARTQTPLAVGETVAGLSNFRRLCDSGAAGVLVFDAGWCAVAPHDCTGPVGFTVGTHLSAALPNAVIQEHVRAHHSTWYRELVEGLPEVTRGEVRPPGGPGLGVRLRPEILERPDARVRTSGGQPAEAGRA
jgi:L-alanine-DL-glutamate epimerase-like enolase superfamily enzyme